MIVYGLVDPRNKELRYVGETIRPMSRRLAQHLRAAKQKTTPPVNAWLRGLSVDGIEPEVIELQVCVATSEMHEAESFWISYLGSVGAELLNIAPGGSTRVGYRHSQETRDKWSRERRGEKGSNFGKRRTPEQKAMFADLARNWIAENGHPLQGRKMSAEFCRNVSAGRKGITPNISPDGWVRKIAASKRNWENPDYRQRMTMPGLSNPSVTPVVVDGTAYGVCELARKLGISRNTVASRIKDLATIGRGLTVADFASRRGKRK